MNKNLEQILNCLRQANAECMIVDTIWMDDDQTLFDFIELCIEEAALAQQQEAEPVAWISRVKCVGPEYGKERYGKLPVQSLNPLYYEHVPLYIHPPKPAAQPQVPEGYKLVPSDLLTKDGIGKVVIVPEVVKGRFSSEMFWRGVYETAFILSLSAKEEGK